MDVFDLWFNQSSKIRMYPFIQNKIFSVFKSAKKNSFTNTKWCIFISIKILLQYYVKFCISCRLLSTNLNEQKAIIIIGVWYNWIYKKVHQKSRQILIEEQDLLLFYFIIGNSRKVFSHLMLPYPTVYKLQDYSK